MNRGIHVAGVVVLGAAGISVVWWMYDNVNKYGWEGTLRYVWEGDHYTPDVRTAMDTLASKETTLAVYESMLECMEESLARGRLNSVDGSEILQAWKSAHTPMNLEKDLARVSHGLDGAAAQVDAVFSSHIDARKKKKLLSQKVVGLMSRADKLMGQYRTEDTTINR